MARRDEAARRASFNALVEEGVYSESFDHPPALKDFVRRMLHSHGPAWPPDRPLRVLDCGCGTGLWLEQLARQLDRPDRPVSCFGFDLSDGMVELARQRLAGRPGEAHIQRGDLLDPAAYRFAAAPEGFDLVFAFDVVQQLPPRHQLAACRLIAGQLAPGGVALVFDHDRASPYGRRMGWRKFVTRYLRVPLLPRYYCDARYPPLARFATRLQTQDGLRTALVADDTTPKMALVITQQEDDGRA